MDFNVSQTALVEPRLWTTASTPSLTEPKIQPLARLSYCLTMFASEFLGPTNVESTVPPILLLSNKQSICDFQT
ncbi:hypothetical protein Hanom_Chr02g00145271 [Helianthus anomalus]